MEGDPRPSQLQEMHASLIISLSEDCHPGSCVWTFDRVGKQNSIINSCIKAARIELLFFYSFLPAAGDMNVHKDLVPSEKEPKVDM